MRITPERLAKIRELRSAHCGCGGDPCLAICELLAEVDELTGQLERARDLAVRCGVFTNSYGEEPKPHEHRWSEWTDYGRQCDDCPAFEMPPGTEARVIEDRPSAYDMPVGSVVVADYDGEDVHTFTRTGSDDWRQEGNESHRIRSDFIEGLFTDGLVTEWRVP